MNKIKFNTGHLILLLFIVAVVFFIIKDFCVKRRIEKSNNFIIVKFESKIRFPKTTDFNFTYFINGKRITTANSGIKYSVLNSEKENDAISHLKINHFYLSKFIPETPNVIIVNPLKLITDTTAILNSGFTKEELKYNL